MQSYTDYAGEPHEVILSPNTNRNSAADHGDGYGGHQSNHHDVGIDSNATGAVENSSFSGSRRVGQQQQQQNQQQQQHQQQQQQQYGPVNTSSRGAFRVNEGMNLYVSQLPPSFNSTKLREVFSQFGAIHSAKVMHDARTNESRCFGFVLFERAQDGDRAIAEMSGVILEEGGNRLQIRVARPTALPQPLRDDAAADGGSDFGVKSPGEGGLSTDEYGDGTDDHNHHSRGSGSNNINRNRSNHSSNNNGNRRTPNQTYQHQQHQQHQHQQSQQSSQLSSPLDSDMSMLSMGGMGGMMMPMMPMAAPMPFGAVYPGGMMPYMAAMPMMPNAGYPMMPSPNVYFLPTTAAYPMMAPPQQATTGNAGTPTAVAASGAAGFVPYGAQWPNTQQPQPKN